MLTLSWSMDQEDNDHPVLVMDQEDNAHPVLVLVRVPGGGPERLPSLQCTW